MTQNTTDNDSRPEAQIETIVVDPDDVIEALRFNGQPPEYKNRRRAVIRLHPAFEAEQEGSLFYTEQGNYYPPEMSPKPIHLRPGLFVNDDAMPIPHRGEERSRARDELDDPTDEEIEEWVETAFEVWENDVRQRLVDELSESGVVWGQDEVDVLAGVSVEYEAQGADQ